MVGIKEIFTIGDFLMLRLIMDIYILCNKGDTRIRRRFWSKPLEPMRCPWCGKYIKSSDFHPSIFKCGEYCHDKEHTIKINKFSFSWMSILTFVFFMFWLSGKCNSIIPILFGIFISWKYYQKLPDIRYYWDKQWWISVPKEPMLGRANIRWYRWKEGGIGFPRLRIVNNTIFAACLIDEKGIPVSHTFCVRLKKKWCFFWKGTKVLLISGEVSSEIWKKADKIVIFNFREKIGEGKVVTNSKGSLE